MVARAGRYFGIPFKGYHRVTQGNPLTPTIFNVVVDSTICYWVLVVAPTEDGTEELGLSIQDLLEYFYANNDLIASTQLERLQRVFDVLAALLNQVGLQTNARETVSMAY